MYVHLGLLILLTIAAFAIMAHFIFSSKQAMVPAAATPAARERAAGSEAKIGIERLKGNWVRPDGGYLLAIKEIDEQGKITAAYFNPRPINISRAEAARQGATLKVFVELRDVNYPGATYSLAYDPLKDQLKGIYVQPALQESFDVVFVRRK